MPRANPVRRHWWLVLVGLLAGFGGGVGTVAASPRVYSSSAAVLVLPVPAQSLAGRLVATEINLDTEAQLARSSQTAAAAAALLGGAQPAQRLVGAVEVEAVANTSVLVLRFEAPTPAAAQAGAQAFAKAYLSNRAQAATKALADQSAALAKKIDGSNRQLATLDAQIAELPTGSAQLDTLRASRQTLTDQIGLLSTRATDLATTTVNAGAIIRDADLPTRPSRPAVGWLLAGGAATGLALGLVAAAARDRLSRRVRGGVDVARHAALPLLAEFAGDLSGPRTLAPRVFAPQQAAGRAFHRLRNEVVAALQPTDGVILVTGASRGRASTVVAANLAAALARADNEVVLVGANVPELGTDGLLLSEVFDIADVPGLTDVLTRRATLATALQRAPRAPRLRIITPGGTASAAGLLQSEAVRAAVEALRELARFVVVEAPSAATGADAQSLARLADAAILVVETGRARHAEVADAARQFEVVGTRVLGAVVLPELSANDDDDRDDDGRDDDRDDDGRGSNDHDGNADAPSPVLHRAEDAALLPTDQWINPATAAEPAPVSLAAMNAPTATHPVVSAAKPKGQRAPKR